jgi:hypothetical protein
MNYLKLGSLVGAAVICASVMIAPASNAEGSIVGPMKRCADPGPYTPFLYTSVNCTASRDMVLTLKKNGFKNAAKQGLQCFSIQKPERITFCQVTLKQETTRMSANTTTGSSAFGGW